MNIPQVSSHQEKDKNELAVFVYCLCVLITLNYNSMKQCMHSVAAKNVDARNVPTFTP